MDKPLKIGFLTPFSAVYPFYGQHIMAGVFTALAQYGLAAKDVVFVPVYIGQGQYKMVEEAIQKLLFFEGVDLISGMVNIKSLLEIAPLFDTYNKPGLFIDFGELIHPSVGYAKNVGCISMNYWQSEYALGKWAVEEFGPDGQIIMPTYESGFNLHQAFLDGAGAAGSRALNSMVMPEHYVDKKHVDLQPFFEAIERDTPNFVHAIFSGSPGTAFLKEWRASKFYDAIPLLTIENMAYRDMLSDVQHLNLKFYAAANWQDTDQSALNQSFTRQFLAANHQPASVFSMLGFELGQVLSQMRQELIKGDAAAAIAKFRQSGVTGPRGMINIQGWSMPAYPMVDINRVVTSDQHINYTVVSQGTALGYDTTQVFEESVSGYLNPYWSV
ncbi:ABC transporter substrate-binding protein [Sphingobacterium faecale]|uniref:ABC transporter substrate-binding protein n=1 Tax=Sphingobacterium faecale TaxID=2803775 RepID=A0ABS1QYP6_9SPHI|nr:ABC transporter substrate-binding protein [Sphingobacterium faecale]MBL1407547.1 ABC transporter substrate-binding protein [Sphingobacterium faecale]